MCMGGLPSQTPMVDVQGKKDLACWILTCQSFCSCIRWTAARCLAVAYSLLPIKVNGHVQPHIFYGGIRINRFQPTAISVVWPALV